MPIEFHSLIPSFKLKNTKKLSEFIQLLAYSEEHEIGDLHYIFCTDSYLLNLNKQYLKHNTLTDIITFDYCVNDEVSGDVFISIDRVKENASTFKQSFEKELHRVLFHGVLHLCGYKDKLPAHKKVMRSKEEFYLNLWESR
ncbi:endoribonuclease YbeY [Bacteroidota bacterium]|nr:endoribonuclease YbeY [Bacteroidota bacterium]